MHIVFKSCFWSVGAKNLTMSVNHSVFFEQTLHGSTGDFHVIRKEISFICRLINTFGILNSYT